MKYFLSPQNHRNLLKTFAALALLCVTGALLPSAQAETVRRPGLVKPRKQLFDHAKHSKHFDSMAIQCTDCHNFAIKPEISGPTSKPVKEAPLKPGPGICHQCHLGKVSVPLRKNCLLCHADLSVIKPQDHFNSWKLRHGKISQMDKDVCTACHSPQDCSSCHAKQNTLNPMVHRPNFRMSHSIQARSEPSACTTCHKSPAFCLDCHTGRKR